MTVKEVMTAEMIEERGKLYLQKIKELLNEMSKDELEQVRKVIQSKLTK